LHIGAFYDLYAFSSRNNARKWTITDKMSDLLLQMNFKFEMHN
jgi:hypothetical protein